jgi:hypothetical protein
MMKNSKANSLGNYYASHRASAILTQNKDREIGRVFADYKDKLVIIAGETRKEHAYLIPKAKVDHYGASKSYHDIWYIPALFWNHLSQT